MSNFLTSIIQGLYSYILSAHYLVIVLIVLVAYILLRESIKRGSESHGFVIFVILSLVFGLLLYLQLFLYALLVFLVLVLSGFYSLRKEEIRAVREEKKNIRIEDARARTRSKAAARKKGKVRD